MDSLPVTVKTETVSQVSNRGELEKPNVQKTIEQMKTILPNLRIKTSFIGFPSDDIKSIEGSAVFGESTNSDLKKLFR